MSNNPKKILIMGLPGAGKTTLASKLVPLLNAVWLNADEVRKKYNDWDFSDEGRIRQANRMKTLAQKFLDQTVEKRIIYHVFKDEKLIRLLLQK